MHNETSPFKLVSCASEHEKVSNHEIELLEAKIKVLSEQITQIGSASKRDEQPRVSHSAISKQFYSPLKARMHKERESNEFVLRHSASVKKRSRIGPNMQSITRQLTFEEDFQDENDCALQDQLSVFAPTDSNVEHLTRFSSSGRHELNPFLLLTPQAISKPVGERSDRKVEQLEAVMNQMFNFMAEKVEPLMDRETAKSL